MKRQAWQRLESDEPKPPDGSPPQPTRRTVGRVAEALEVPLKDTLAAAGFAPLTEETVHGQEAAEDIHATLRRMERKLDEVLGLVKELEAKVNAVCRIPDR